MDRTTPGASTRSALRLLPGSAAPQQTTHAAVREVTDLLTAYEQAIYAFDFDKAVRLMQAVVFCSVHLLDVANQRKQAFAAVHVVKDR